MTEKLIEERNGDLILRVRASPGAARDRVLGVHGGALKVSVRAPPEGGKANAAVARLLAAGLGLRAGQLRLVRGKSSRDKSFLLDGVSRQELAARLRTLLGSG